jgi:rhamnose utilization protein RhaD (predicted bifunctional aldolase and dehydrogenase)
MMLDELVELSHYFGKNSELVLAGGGNSSCKDDNIMFIKGSGTSLATITAEEFVGMDRKKLEETMEKKYSADETKREAEVLANVMDARLPGNMSKRPSIETLLHNLFPARFVMHLHPPLVNGLTCGKNGKKFAAEFFGESFAWIPAECPGYLLAMSCKKIIGEYMREKGVMPKYIFLGNHGIFASAEDIAAIKENMAFVMDRLTAAAMRKPDFSMVPRQKKAETEDFKKALSGLFPQNAVVLHTANEEIIKLTDNENSFAPLARPFTPDHIVYCKARLLRLKYTGDVKSEFSAFVAENGYEPKVICVKGLGAFFIGFNAIEAKNAKMLFMDAVKIAAYAENFGGYLHLPDDIVNFILGWEMETYRQKVAQNMNNLKK